MTITPILAHGNPLLPIALGAFMGSGASIIAGVVLRYSRSATARHRRTGAFLCVGGIAMILGLFLFWRQFLALYE